MVFLDFEQPLESLYEQLETIKKLESEGDIDVTDKIKQLNAHIRKKKKEIFTDLTPWQKVQLSRHPARPHTLFYICLLYTSPSPRDRTRSRMPSSA